MDFAKTKANKTGKRHVFPTTVRTWYPKVRHEPSRCLATRKVSLNMLGKTNMAGHSCKQCILSRVESEARVHWHARKPQVAKWHSTTFKLKLRDAGLPVPARERERRRGARI